MSESEETEVALNKLKNMILERKRMQLKKKKILEHKKKLLEIYAIVSGLIIASIQATGTLIAVNTSINYSKYIETISNAKLIIGAANLAFFLFVFILLVYYTSIFDDDLIMTFCSIVILSVTFSSMLAYFIFLQASLQVMLFLFLLILIFIAMFLVLFHNSILVLEIENKSLKTNDLMKYFQKFDKKYIIERINRTSTKNILIFLRNLFVLCTSGYLIYLILCIKYS